MAFQQSGARQIDEQWKEITNKVIDCVLETSPSDKTLAYYLGKDVQNDYQVQFTPDLKFGSNYKSDTTKY